MANAIRKRIALAAALVVGAGLLAAVPTQAAITASTGATVTTPDIVRVSYNNDITVTLTSPETASAGQKLGLAILQKPSTSGNTLSLETATALSAGDTQTVLTFNPDVAGTYVVRPYWEGGSDDVYTAGGNDVLIGTAKTISVAGAPASFTFASASGSSGPGAETKVAVNVVDANGNPTLLGSSFISLSVTDSTATNAAVVAAATGGSTVSALTGTNDAIFVKDADAGSTVVVSGLLSASGATAQTYTLTTAAYGATKPASISVAPAVAGQFAGNATDGYSSALVINKFNVTISGVDANKTVHVTKADGGSVSSTLSASAPVADANGSVTVSVTVTGAANGDSVTVTAAKNTTDTATVSAVVNFENAANEITASPAVDSVNYVATGSTNAVTVTIADQYGVPAVGAVVSGVVTVPSGAAAVTVASAATNAAGVATLSVVLPSTAGTYTLAISAKDAQNNTISAGAGNITMIATATGAPAKIEFTSGVTTETDTIKVHIPSNGVTSGRTSSGDSTINAATASGAGEYTAIVFKVSDAAGAGVNGVTVTVTPGAGVYMSKTAAPTATTKLSALTNAATTATTAGGGLVTIYAVGTKAGVNEVTFAAGGSSAVAKFTAEHGFGSNARNVAITGAASAAGGAFTTYTATVTDAFGNVVKDADVVFTVGALGRLASGAKTATVSTDASGQAKVELTAGNTETGSTTLAAGIATADLVSGDLTGNLSTLSEEEIASASLTVTITASTTVDQAAANAAAIAKVQEQVTALAASVTTLIAALSGQVKRLQTALTNLRKLVRAL